MAKKPVGGGNQAGDNVMEFVAAKLEIAIDGHELVHVVSIEGFGSLVDWHMSEIGLPVGGYRSFGAGPGAIRVRVSGNSALRDIANSEESVKGTHTITFRWMGVLAAPICTQTITGTYIERFIQEKLSEGSVPVEAMYFRGGTTTYQNGAP